ncbi:MIT domain protein [Ancylostoma caninum]|uniref:MIT domain protein n=1 Tax=Ancylostoma caninum TaxID=29170 RepID=A0A368GKP4_ANCCA|nr:MIT domain protein [Ancylostoma caninum]
MSHDDAATASALQLAQRAISFDQAQRYEEAIYCYGEAADRIMRLLQAKKMSPNFRKNAMEYVERAEFLKSDLPRLLERSRATKHPSRLLLEKVEFLLLKAQLLDEEGHYSLAIDLYSEATQSCIEAGKGCSDEELRLKLRTLGNNALERLEYLKCLEEKRKLELLTENLPDVPVDELSRLNVNSNSPSGSSSPTPHSPILPHKASGLTKEELAVLAITSSINGRKYVPFLSVDLKEKFNYTIPFCDKDGKLSLTEKQKKRIKAWLRPHEIFEEPKVIGNVDSGTIKQTVISDCSFVASLSITARYEKRFGKQIITSIIFPQNKAGQPVYNPSGKYMVKFHINGVWRKVIIDDYLPTGENLELLCSHSQEKGELWVSLLEKAYLKVMGGYDFPGSNSNIDLHALTGWIPDRIAIKTDSPNFNGNKIFEKLLSRFHRGDCLITLATGKLSESICERAGLVECHAYAVLDLRRVDGKRLLMVKNPWTHLRWKGRYSENDSVSWTPALCRALDYDPSQAKVKDDGVFWIDFESVCHFFDVFYVNWNPALFPFTYGLHATWDSCTGPVKDLYSVADNPQYCLEVHNRTTSAVWILLTRHITDITDFAENKEYITVMVYKSGKKIYIPIDPKPLYEGMRINSPHYLCQMVVSDPGPQKYTLVVAQYEKMNTIYYTLRVYSSCQFNLSPIKSPYTVKKTETGKWEGRSAGGCGNGSSRETYKNNPLFHISLEESSDENLILVDLKGPKQYSVGFEILQVSSPRNKPFERKDSGVYRPGYTVLALERVPAGVYSIRPMTFLAGQEGPFILKVEASCGFSMKRVQ